MDILIIAPNDFEALEKKSVLYQYENYKEGKFFTRVISFFPFGRKNLITNIDTDKFFFQYGWRSRFEFFNKFKIMKFIGILIIVFKIFFAFPLIIRKYDIKVIRATDPYLMGLIGLFYSKLLNIPFVVSIHSDYDKGEELGGQTFTLFGSRSIPKKIEKFVYMHCDLILPIRDYLKQKIIQEYFINENKIELFPHGIDSREFDDMEYINIYEKYDIDRAIKIISFIGRLSSENYVDDVITIAKELLKKRKDFVLLILGDGKEYQNMQNVIKQESIDNFVRLVGFEGKNVVVNTRKQSFISLTLMGGFSLIEACIGARPVISYDIEWHYELVKNNETGYLIEENNVTLVVEKILFLFNNPDIANQFGSNARNLALENNNIKNTMIKKQQIFEKILRDTIK